MWAHRFDPVLNSPTTSSLGYNSSSGSILGMFFLIQISSGILLTLFYDNSETAFDSVQQLQLNSSLGYLLRNIHFYFSNGIFFVIYFHVGKTVLDNSYRNTKAYLWGITLLLLSMLVAFLGYVLVYSQISYWAAIVITGLLSIISYDLAYFFWSNYSVGVATINAFFTLHFILPLLIPIGIVWHIHSLHEEGSSSTLGTSHTLQSMEFYSFYWVKDLLNLSFILVTSIIFLYNPSFISEYEMSDPSNSLNSPDHIVPQWYFLWAYAILRAIPNKVLGVTLFLVAVLILFLFTLLWLVYLSKRSSSFLLFVIYLHSLLILSVLGSSHAEDPFVLLAQVLSSIYFGSYFLLFKNSLLLSELDNPVIC